MSVRSVCDDENEREPSHSSSDILYPSFHRLLAPSPPAQNLPPPACPAAPPGRPSLSADHAPSRISGAHLTSSRAPPALASPKPSPLAVTLASSPGCPCPLTTQTPSNRQNTSGLLGASPLGSRVPRHSLPSRLLPSTERAQAVHDCSSWKRSSRLSVSASSGLTRLASCAGRSRGGVIVSARAVEREERAGGVPSA